MTSQPSPTNEGSCPHDDYPLKYADSPDKCSYCGMPRYQPSPTNLSDELKELVKRDIAFLLGAKASDIDPDSAAMQIVDEIMSATTAAYAEAIEAIIGEDEESRSDVDQRYNDRAFYRRKLRAEQRQRLQGLLPNNASDGTKG